MMQGAEIENYSKDPTELVVTYPVSGKPQKLFLKTKDEQERDEWVTALNEISERSR